MATFKSDKEIMKGRNLKLYAEKIADWRRDHDVLLVRALVDREDHGLPKTVVAELTGCSLSTVKRWCKGHADDHLKGDHFIAEDSSISKVS